MGKFNPTYIVFADGSYRQVNDVSYAACGVVIMNPSTGKYAEFGEMTGGSVVFAEGWGVYRGLQKALEIANGEFVDILVMTDSRMTVQVLNVFLPYMWKERDDILYTAQGTPVKNQWLYKKIRYLIRSHPEADIRIRHMKGHMAKDGSGEEELTRWLIEDSLINAQGRTAKIFIRMNDRADKIARDLTKKAKKEGAKDGFLRIRRRY